MPPPFFIGSPSVGCRRQRLVCRRVPARGSVAGRAVKIPLHFVHRDFGCVFPTWPVRTIENPGTPFVEGLYCPVAAATPPPSRLPGEQGYLVPTPCPLP